MFTFQEHREDGVDSVCQTQSLMGISEVDLINRSEKLTEDEEEKI